jgi:hypothetical protein
MRRKPFDLVEKNLKTLCVVENYYTMADYRNPLIDVEKRSNSLSSVERKLSLHAPELQAR